jgi:hypothetical protein
MKTDMLKGPQTPPLYDTLIGVKKNVMRSLRCCVPGNVTAFYPAAMTADIQIALLQQNSDGSSSTYPQLLGCPVVTLQGGGTTPVAAAFPIKAGDQCLVFFADRCIDAWFKTGTPQQLPNLRMHDLSDGFALVGVNSLNHPLVLSLLATEGGLADAQAKVAINPTTHLITIANQTQNLKLILTTLFTALAADPGLSGASHTALAAASTALGLLLY